MAVSKHSHISFLLIWNSFARTFSFSFHSSKFTILANESRLHVALVTEQHAQWHPTTQRAAYPAAIMNNFVLQNVVMTLKLIILF